MADAAVDFLLNNLKNLENDHKKLITDNTSDNVSLEGDIHMLEAFLRESVKKLGKEVETEALVPDIRNLVYELEDIVDVFINKAVQRNSKSRIRRLLSSTRQLPKIQQLMQDVTVRVAVAITDIAFADRKVADEPRPEKDVYELMDRPILGGLQPPDQTIRRDKVVGFEDDEAKLMGYLTEETKEFDVISIIGMPGLGKTTLAWKIYENKEICFKFPIRIWVYVSQRFNSRDVFLNILRKFTRSDMSGHSDEELAQSVRAYLAKEKFLIVMDDVWSPDDWKVIENALPKGNGSSKVMITSRHKSVGTHANVSREPHLLRFFRPDESLKLLQLEVYGKVEYFPGELLIVGQKIANQCDGVPLTVIVVGGILVDLFEKTRIPAVLRKEWEKVSQNVNDFVHNDPEKRISDVVKLSYDRLPEHLRVCFLYMAVFPEEHVIPSWMLIRLWIAEGFIQPRGKSVEEAAEENLGDLVSRNLLMLDDINPMGEIKTCRVHDMIRGFCRERALEQNLFQEIKNNKQGILEPPVSEVPKFHRLCIHSDLNKFFLGKPNGPSIRSFLCLNKEPINLDPKYISTIPDAFLKLRVLESISIKFHQFPAKVTKLFHLRYVTLNIDSLSLLPEPLAQLWNLQTLIVETKSSLITMKANIWKMYHLRHLKMKAAIVLDDKWEGEGGENLQTLTRLAPQSCTAKVCERASNLKELGIRGKLAILFRTMSMENMERLKKLKLIHDYNQAQPLNGLPQARNFPPNLQRLTLSYTFLDWEHASTLAQIPTLEVLKLKNNAFKGTSWNAANDVFENLQILIVIEADFVVWMASGDNFPYLRCLVLKNCDKLEIIPGDVGRNLETLEIERLRKSAVDSARSIERMRKAAQEQNRSKWAVKFKLQVGPGCQK